MKNVQYIAWRLDIHQVICSIYIKLYQFYDTSGNMLNAAITRTFSTVILTRETELVQI